MVYLQLVDTLFWRQGAAEIAHAQVLIVIPSSVIYYAIFNFTLWFVTMWIWI